MDANREEQNDSQVGIDAPVIETTRNADGAQRDKAAGEIAESPGAPQSAQATSVPLYLGICFLIIAVLGLPLIGIKDGDIRYPSIQTEIGIWLSNLLDTFFDLPGEGKLWLRINGCLIVTVCAPVGAAMIALSSWLSAKSQGKSVRKAANWLVRIGVCGLLLGGGTALGLYENLERYGGVDAGEAARLIAGWGMGVGAVILLLGLFCSAAQERPDVWRRLKRQSIESLRPREDTTCGKEKQKHYCPSCGAKLMEGQAFCTFCGAKL